MLSVKLNKKSAKDKMEQILNDLHWRLEEFELSMRKQIDNLDEFNIEMYQYSVDNRTKWFKSIVHYMVNGLTYQQAVQLLCDDENLDPIKIENLLKSFDYQRKATDMYAKIFFCKKLKDAGYTNKKIAELLHCSAVTVAKLLKCKVKLV